MAELVSTTTMTTPSQRRRRHHLAERAVSFPCVVPISAGRLIDAHKWKVNDELLVWWTSQGCDSDAAFTNRTLTHKEIDEKMIWFPDPLRGIIHIHNLTLYPIQQTCVRFDVLNHDRDGLSLHTCDQPSNWDVGEELLIMRMIGNEITSVNRRRFSGWESLAQGSRCKLDACMSDKSTNQYDYFYVYPLDAYDDFVQPPPSTILEPNKTSSTTQPLPATTAADVPSFRNEAIAEFDKSNPYDLVFDFDIRPHVGGGLSYDLMYVRQEGTELIVQLTSIPMVNADGKRIRFRQTIPYNDCHPPRFQAILWKSGRMPVQCNAVDITHTSFVAMMSSQPAFKEWKVGDDLLVNEVGQWYYQTKIVAIRGSVVEVERPWKTVNGPNEVYRMACSSSSQPPLSSPPKSFTSFGELVEYRRQRIVTSPLFERLFDRLMNLITNNPMMECDLQDVPYRYIDVETSDLPTIALSTDERETIQRWLHDEIALDELRKRMQPIFPGDSCDIRADSSTWSFMETPVEKSTCSND
jgi:hypothetical protein